MSRRDDFFKKTIELLARRVAYQCSNPKCKTVTIGPSSKPTETVNIGVAAHITAAAPGGKRYDPTLTKEERKGFDNGIWLCQNCAKLIDSDELEYSIDVLRNWKIEAENAARNNFEVLHGFSSSKMDRTVLAQATLLEQLGEMLSDDTDKSIETIRNTWREGYKEDAKNQLKSLKSDRKRWTVLSNQVKAKLLRFEAGLVLDSENGLFAAKDLADQAYELDPSAENQSKIKALIARQEGNLSNAISHLENNKDVDSLNMLAAFYLEIGDSPSCRKVLEGIDLPLVNAESYRLRALLHLFDKDIVQARANINKAEQLSPKWYIVKLNRAMIDFFSAISNALIPDRPILWPEPITPDMVKKDKESVSNLQNATNMFEELSKYEYLGVDSEFIRNWLLACQFVSFTKQDAISDLIRNNLKSNPADYYLIFWALELNFDFDFTSSEKAILKLLASGNGTIFQILALSRLLIKRTAWVDAERILNEYHGLFKLQNAESLWQFWKIQLLGLQGKFDEANNIIEQFQPDQNLRYAKGLVLSVQAQKTGNNGSIANYLEQQFFETNDPFYLLQLCKLKFSEHDWKFVTNWAKFLVASFQTSDILRFAVVAAFNFQDFGMCLELLEENQFMFGSETPGDIRRLKAISLRRQGLLKAAITEMESLPLQSTENLFQMAQMYLQQGDLKKFTIMGRQLVEKPDLGPIEALQLAHYLRQEDPELAKILYKQAETRGLPLNYLGGLLFTAFNLGLDNETKPLHELIGQANSEETGLKFITLDDLKRIIIQGDTEAHKVESLFMKGDIPVYLFAQNRNINLVHLYHTFLDNNEKEPNAYSKIPMFVRHGGKPIAETIQDFDEKDLYMDITSILLAEHLGILDKVENTFNMIKIPDEAIVFLVEMRDQLLPHQPSKINAADQIVDLAEQGKIKVIENEIISLSTPPYYDGNEIEALSKYAQDDGGKVVVFKDNTKEKRSTNPIFDMSFVNARNVIDTLLKYGKISLEKQGELIDLLGTEGNENDSDSDLRIGTVLYFWENTIDLFTGIGALELVLNHFEVYIQSDFLKRQKQGIQHYKQNEQVSKWLQNLIEKLRRGIDREKYQLIGAPLGSKDDQWEFDPFNNLKSLFTFPKTDKALIWSDDRHLNSFSNRDGIPIIGINEILNLLVLSGSIDQKTYFSVLNRMRASNLLFIPLIAEEICYFLLQTPSHESLLKETPELVVMKSYAMRALQMANCLQKPATNQSNQQGEIAFLFQCAHAPLDAISNLWKSNDISIDEKKLYSNWILENLFVDYSALVSMLGIQQAKEYQEYLAALKLMELIIRGFSLTGKNKENQQSIRVTYLNWLYERLITSEVNFNTKAFNTSLGLLKQFILDNKQESVDQIPPEVLDQMFQNFCSELPKQIRQRLEDDDNFMTAIGVHFLIDIGDYQFDADEFWNMVGQVANVGKSKITPKNCNHQISIVLDSTGTESGILSIIDSNVEKPFTIRIPEFELLNPNMDSITTFLRKNRGLFDCSDQELTEINRNILSAPSLRLRVDRFLKSQEMNLGSSYSKLLERLSVRQNFTIDEMLPPNTSHIARFYRINSKGPKSFSLLWKDSAESLLNSLGIVETLSRLWSVPISLPESIFLRFDKLEPKRQRKYLKALLHNSQSPIALLHMTKLLLHLGAKNPSYRRLGLKKLKYMLSEPYETEAKALLSVTSWVTGFLRVKEGDNAIIRLLTIWTHAHQLFLILKTAGATTDWIQKFFSQNLNSLTNLFENDSEIYYDVSFPKNITSQAMILNGFIYCATGEIQDLGDEIRLSLANICFIHTGDRILPHPFLLDDVTMLTDHLESIWSGDRGNKLSRFLGTKSSKLLSSPSLHNLLLIVLRNLETRKFELSPWVDLFATTRGVNIPHETKGKLIDILSNTDYCQLFEKDIALGRLALHLASIVAYTSNSEKFTTYLIEQLVAIAKKFSVLYHLKEVKTFDEETQNKLWDIVGILLEATFNISKLKNTPEERAITFADLTKEIAKCWGYFAISSKPVIQTLCERLPVEQSNHVWPLLIFLRTIG